MSGPVHLTKRAEIAISHRLTAPGHSAAEDTRVYGLEAQRHGHNLLVETTLRGDVDASTGMVINLKELKTAMHAVLTHFDHQDLNQDHPIFTTTAPTGERIAEAIHQGLVHHLPHQDVARVRMIENEDTVYESQTHPYPPTPTATTLLLTRRYRFSAAHRLHAPDLDAAQNQRLFLNCNNPNGHGHDYRLEVTVQGDADPVTGMVMPPERLDEVVHRTIVDRYHYHDLNDDLPEYAGRITTSENVIRTIWDTLATELKTPTLFRVQLAETRDNIFEYYG